MALDDLFKIKAETEDIYKNILKNNEDKATTLSDFNKFDNGDADRLLELYKEGVGNPYTPQIMTILSNQLNRDRALKEKLFFDDLNERQALRRQVATTLWSQQKAAEQQQKTDLRNDRKIINDMFMKGKFKSPEDYYKLLDYNSKGISLDDALSQISTKTKTEKKTKYMTPEGDTYSSPPLVLSPERLASLVPKTEEVQKTVTESPFKPDEPEYFSLGVQPTVGPDGKPTLSAGFAEKSNPLNAFVRTLPVLGSEQPAIKYYPPKSASGKKQTPQRTESLLDRARAQAQAKK